MIELLKEVGRGKRGARDLTYEEASRAAAQIVSLQATPAQIGAFLMAERIKMESPDELAAFVDILRQHAARTPLPPGVDSAGPYDGRRKSYMATFAAAFLLAAASVPATLHGTASLPPKWGITLQEMLQSAGIFPHKVARDRAAQIARDTGVLYAHADTWCPPLAQLRPLREQLGMRTVFNTAEKLVDYAHSPHVAIGVYHNTVFERLSALLQRLAYRNAVIVQGIEGSEDLFVGRPTRVLVLRNGRTHRRDVDPQAYGMDKPTPEIEWTAGEQLRVTEAILSGSQRCHAAFVHQTLLNAALRLELAERADDLREGIEIGKRALASGQAWQIYTQWKAAWQTAAQ